jgi:hypothetical protein
MPMHYLPPLGRNQNFVNANQTNNPMAKSKKVTKKKEGEIRKAMFANMESSGDLYPKSKTGKRVAPKKKKAAKKNR